MAMDRNAFVHAMVAALKEAESSQSLPKTSGDLAKSCHEKLQFDFAAVSAGELAALAQYYRKKAEASAGSLQLAITAKLVQNVSDGALHQTEVKTEPQRDQPGDRRAADASSQAGAKAAAPRPLFTSGDIPSRAALKPQYQELCACLLVKMMRRVVSSDQPTAAKLLARYEAREDGGQQALDRNPASFDDSAHVQHQLSGAAALGGAEGEEKYAAESDQDDEEYEELCMEQMQSSSRAAGADHSMREDAAAAGLGSTARQGVREKLQDLAAMMHVAAMPEPRRWAGLQLLEDITATLVHLKDVDAEEHLPADVLRSSYLQLLADFLALDADTLALAPGVSAQLQGGAGHRPSTSAAESMQLELLSLLAAKVGGSQRLRGQFFQQVQQQHLPLLRRCLEGCQAAQQLQRRQPRAAGGSGNGCGGGGAETGGREQACLELLAGLPLHRQAAGGLALLQAGMLRPMAAAWLQHDGGAAARRALLLATASHAEVARWVSGVAGVRAALAADASREDGGHLDSTIWPLALQLASSRHRKDAGEAGDGLRKLLLSLCCTEHLSRLHDLLQLLVDCHTAAGGRQVFAEVADALHNVQSFLGKPPDRATASFDQPKEWAADEGRLGATQLTQRSAAEGVVYQKSSQLRTCCLQLMKRLLFSAVKHD